MYIFNQISVTILRVKSHQIVTILRSCYFILEIKKTPSSLIFHISPFLFALSE